MSDNKSIFNKIMSIDMDDDGPDKNNLHKSRFEGDNFRKRYMSKCQGESTAEKIARLERIDLSAKNIADEAGYIYYCKFGVDRFKTIKDLEKALRS